MGFLSNGKWVVDTPNSSKEKFRRDKPAFLLANKVPDVSSQSLCLIISKACPWCHYTLLIREFTNLRSVIGVRELSPIVADRGWSLRSPIMIDSKRVIHHVYQLYLAADSTFSGRATAPLLINEMTGKILSNDSSDIGNSLFKLSDGLTKTTHFDLFPDHLSGAIKEIDEFIYSEISNRVYEVGFSRDQEEYDQHISKLFSALEKIETRLLTTSFLLGCYITEPDLRLFVALIRFDVVYFNHFKCSQRLMREVPAIRNYLSRLMSFPEIASTVDFTEIATHYYKSHRHLNPTGIIPRVGGLGFNVPH